MSTADASAENKQAAHRRLFAGRPVRFLMLLLIVISLALVGAARPAPAQARATSTTIRFEETFPFSFFNECTGEVVSGVVSLKGAIRETVDASGGFHFHLHEVFRGKAVGETSGLKYVGPQTDHESFVESSGGTIVDTFTLNFRFISQGKADNIQTRILFHITITPAGEVTSEINRFTIECRG